MDRDRLVRVSPPIDRAAKISPSASTRARYPCAPERLSPSRRGRTGLRLRGDLRQLSVGPSRPPHVDVRDAPRYDARPPGGGERAPDAGLGPGGGAAEARGRGDLIGGRASQRPRSGSKRSAEFSSPTWSSQPPQT